MIDERTEKYFEAIKKNVGFLGANAGWNSINEILNKKGLPKAELIKKYDGFMNSSDIEIYKYEKDGEVRYCAEFSYQTDIDDYCIETLIFNRFPSNNDVDTMITLKSLEIDFKCLGRKVSFDCWECGKSTHWLDVKGTLKDKKNSLENKYCGEC